MMLLSLRQIPSLHPRRAGPGPAPAGFAKAPFLLFHAKLPLWPTQICIPDMGFWLLRGTAPPARLAPDLSAPCCADVPVEDLLGDENLAALEAGQDSEIILLDSLELNDPEAKPKKKGKSKAAAKGSPAKKPAKAGSAKASTDMQVCRSHLYDTMQCIKQCICIRQSA